MSKGNIAHDSYVFGFANGRREAMTITYHLALFISRQCQADGDSEGALAAEKLADLIQGLNHQLLPIVPQTRLAATYRPSKSAA